MSPSSVMMPIPNVPMSSAEAAMLLNQVAIFTPTRLSTKHSRIAAPARIWMSCEVGLDQKSDANTVAKVVPTPAVPATKASRAAHPVNQPMCVLPTRLDH